MTQRVLDKEGTLRALLTVAIKLEVFARFYDVTTLPKKSFLAVTDHNGIRMLYYPAQDNTNPIGKPIQAKPWNIASNGTEEGLFFATGSDGLRRIFAYGKLQLSVENTPYLYVWAGIPEDYILKPANAALTRNVLLLSDHDGVSVYLLGDWSEDVDFSNSAPCDVDTKVFPRGTSKPASSRKRQPERLPY